MGNPFAMHNKLLKKPTEDIDPLYKRIACYLHSARENVLQVIDTTMVKVYWAIGREIVEEEQKGAIRATYGEELIKKLAAKLMHEFGKGYSISNLRNMRRFYLVYQDQIYQTVSGEFVFEPKLSWSKYCLLMQLPILAARLFYEQAPSS